MACFEVAVAELIQDVGFINVDHLKPAVAVFTENIKVMCIHNLFNTFIFESFLDRDKQRKKANALLDVGVWDFLAKSLSLNLQCTAMSTRYSTDFPIRVPFGVNGLAGFPFGHACAKSDFNTVVLFVGDGRTAPGLPA